MSQEPNKYCIIFDFDGVIHDTKTLLTGVYNKIIGKYKLSLDITDEIFQKSPKKVLQKYGDTVYNEFNNEYTEAFNCPIFFKDILEIIKECTNRKYLIILITAQPKKRIIKIKEIKNFNKIYDWADTYGKKDNLHKDLILKIIKENTLSKEYMYYISDSFRDIEVAKSVGIKSIWASWGLFAEKDIISNKPDYIVNKPIDLKSILFVNCPIRNL